MERFDQAQITRKELAGLLRGGFAPVVILLREFHYDKTAVMLDGLPYSTWSLLEHMRRRQALMLRFMKDPAAVENLWPAAYWPDDPNPGTEERWLQAINAFEKDLDEIIRLVEAPGTPLYEPQPNGYSFFWAAVATLQHNGYHIGQIKAVGRQLGVW